MMKVNKYLNDIIKELEGILAGLEVKESSKTLWLKASGKRDGLVTAIDVIKKYKSDD